MKNLALVLLSLHAASASAFANDGSNIDFSETLVPEQRELVFNLAPRDAMKCGNEIIGNHLSNATVYKIVNTTKEGTYIYYELSDHLDFTYRCTEASVQKLAGYFDQVRGRVKLKNLTRVFQSTSNSISCKVEGQYTLRAERNSKFLVVKTTYGQRELTPYMKKEITHEIYNDLGKKIAACDEFAVSVATTAEDLSYSDLALFNTNVESAKKTGVAPNTIRSLGACLIEHDYNGWISIRTMFLGESIVLLTTASSNFDVLWKLITSENCMLNTVTK